MKKILLAILLVSTFTVADACCYRGYNRGGYYWGGNGWVAPALIGGVIGYELARPPLYVEQPVIVQPPVVIPQQTVAPVGYHFVTIQDPSCNCYKQALVPN